MINLLYLIELHFRCHDSLLHHPRVQALLDNDLSEPPDRLAITIYRLQNELIHHFGEIDSSEILLMLSYIQRMYTQTEIYYSARIGENLRIVHGLGVVVGARVVIGDNVTLYQNVTLGARSHEVRGRPVIEEHSVIYAGSRVLGDITIGKHCIVAANSVVLDSFPDFSLIAGSPARHVRRIEVSQ